MAEDATNAGETGFRLPVIAIGRMCIRTVCVLNMHLIVIRRSTSFNIAQSYISPTMSATSPPQFSTVIMAQFHNLHQSYSRSHGVTRRSALRIVAPSAVQRRSWMLTAIHLMTLVEELK